MNLPRPLVRCARRVALAARAGRVSALVLTVCWLVLGLLAVDAQARPGGGQSYSGGSSGGGGGGSYGGGGGGGGELVFLLVRLVLVYPQVGVPIAIIVVVALVAARRKDRGLTDWDSAETVAVRAPPPDLTAIARVDPQFSAVLFEDFAFALYARAHQARGVDGGLAELAPYLSSGVRAALAERAPVGEPVAGVIIGGLRATSLSVPEPAADAAANDVPRCRAVLHYEANMTVGQPDTWRTYYVRESWTFERPIDVVTAEPARARSLDCPNCGAVFESSDEATCSYCGEVVGGGRFGWQVTHVALHSMEARPPALISHAEERGTDLDTVLDPRREAGLVELQAADPQLSNESLLPRLQLIHDEVNAAWSNLDLVRARPFVSDSLYNYLLYYVRAYEQEGLRNVHESPQLLRWVIAKVTRDAHYDALTVRIWGEGRDYTLETATGKVVGGHRQRVRAYSEYWTLVRGAAVRGEPRADKQCPNCGAALQINMAGVCEYCSAHITAGEFDWVLSKIEQDEAYRG